MLINHLIISLRIIRRHKVHAAINILGLTFAMAVSIIIMLYVQDDFRHEERHANVDRIFRVYREYPDMGKLAKVALTSQPLAAALKRHLQGIEDAVTLTNPNSAWVRHEGPWLKIIPLHFTNPSFFRIFSLEVLSGTLAGALEDPRSAILTTSAAKKIFGSRNAVGKKLFVRSVGDFTVAAVIEDPQRTHLRLGVILPMDRYVFRLDLDPKWINNFTTYVLAGRYESEENLRTSVANYSKIYAGAETKEVYRLQPLRRVWLHSDLAYDFLRAPYRAELDYVMLTVVLSILAMACLNYINIETARAGRRAAEVSLRKALGAGRRQLISQFLGEACVLCLLALFLAVILVETVLPAFNRFVILKELKLFDPLNADILLFLIGTALATGLAAGSYPALLLSAIKPAEVLKRISHRVAGATLRQIMVAAQFSVSILLILATLTLAAQLEYLCQKDPGYDPKNLVTARLTEAVVDKYDAFKADLLSHPNITAVTAARDLPNWRGPSIILKDWEGRQGGPDFPIYHGSVDRDFIETMRIELLKGISFAGDDPGGQGLIVNQAAVDAMGMSDPLGSYMAGWSHEGRIIGVVKNYFYNNMREPLEPLVLKVSPDDIRFFFARISPENTEETLAFIERQWRRYEPELPVDLLFFEKIISGMYLTEEKLSKLFGWAALVAIWISTLGLYGLTTFIAAQRSKEIAIRKSYGASIGNILKMLTLQYLKIVLAANLVAWPVAYLSMNRWLATFEQHIGLNWTLFVLAAIISILVVLATVLYQALKTASANPVDALRYE